MTTFTYRSSFMIDPLPVSVWPEYGAAAEQVRYPTHQNRNSAPVQNISLFLFRSLAPCLKYFLWQRLPLSVPLLILSQVSLHKLPLPLPSHNPSSECKII